MNNLLQLIKEASHRITFIECLRDAPLWLKIVIPAAVLAGVVIALRSKAYINRLFWLIIVLSIPVIGTVIEAAAIALMKYLDKKVDDVEFDYSFRSRIVCIPVIVGFLVRAAIMLLEKTDNTDILPERLTADGTDLFPVTAGILAVFLIFLGEYSRYRKSGIYLHLKRTTEEDEDGGAIKLTTGMSEKKAGMIYGKKVTEETGRVIPDTEYAYKIAKRYFSGIQRKTGRLGCEKYDIDYIDYSEFSDEYDVEKAEYCGMGMMKYLVLRWKKDEDGTEKAKRMVLWYKPAPFMPYYVELVTSLAVMIGLFTPFVNENAVRFTERVIDIFT